MGIDASIYSQIQQPKIESPLNALAQMTQVKNAQNQNRLFDMKLAESDRALDDDNAVRQAYANPDAAKRLDALRSASPKAYREESTFQSTQDTAERAKQKAVLESHLQKFDIAARIMGPVKDQASWEAARQQTAQLLGPEAAAQMPQQYDPNLIEQKRMQAMTVKEQLEQKWKAMEYTTPNANAVLGSQTSLATNAASNATSRANNSATVGATLRGQNRTDARSREANAQPKGQVVQTDQGTMLVNPRDGTAQPVTAGGQALQPKLKDLPAPIQKSLIENSTSLRKIDQALAAIDQYPAALGLKNYLGDGIRQRSDPTGVEARALVADIGSLKIHDRSGAAVTASETPRLKPFIPAATDDPATVKKKLNLFKQEYEAIQSDITSTYTREQGYRPPTVTPAGGLPSDVDALLKKHGGK